MFLKNFAKLTEIHICRGLFFNKAQGCRLKRNSGSGAFLKNLKFCEIFKYCYSVVHLRTAASDILGYPYGDILYKGHIEERQIFIHFNVYSFQTDFRILHNLRGVFRTISNIYDAETLDLERF